MSEFAGAGSAVPSLNPYPLITKMIQNTEYFTQSVLSHARTDFAVMKQDTKVADALMVIRKLGGSDKAVYFYVVDSEDRLVGVVPTRRLLIECEEKQIAEMMIRNVISVPADATVFNACEFFVLHRFFALPVVDDDRRLIGIIDISVLTERVLDFGERKQIGDVFETLGFHIDQVRDAAPVKAFRYRFPWLLATIVSGTVCAVLAGAFELTLAKSIVLTFFMTLVLGLGESVSMQSMTLTIQALNAVAPNLKWYVATLRRELTTACMLGGACGICVSLIVWLWRGDLLAATTIGLSILISIASACLIGLSIPSALHALKLDPKIAAGPVTLAATDVCALLFYLSLAAVML